MELEKLSSGLEPKAQVERASPSSGLRYLHRTPISCTSNGLQHQLPADSPAAIPFVHVQFHQFGHDAVGEQRQRVRGKDLSHRQPVTLRHEKVRSLPLL